MKINHHEWHPRLGAGGAAGLGPDEIQLWWARVAGEEREPGGSEGCLSPDERVRAGCFSSREARREFVHGRAFLRQLLGVALRVDPAGLRFDQPWHGKPRLRPVGGSPDLRFNLSHSGGRVVVALALGREVGVDLEWMPGLEDWAEVAGRVFSRRELVELQALPTAEQRAAFFNGWTRKEAWLKATGEGLTDNLTAIEVTLAPGRPPTWLALPDGAVAMRRWRLWEIRPPGDFSGALVHEVFPPPHGAATASQ